MAPSAQLEIGFTVHLDGEKLAPEPAAAILGVGVYRTRGASAFELTVGDPEGRWRDDPLFTDCRSVRIEVDSGAGQSTLFEGEVTAWRTELERRGPSVLVLRGMDLSHRMMRGTKTRTFADASPLDVARRIAADAGLRPVLSEGNEPAIKAFRFQANQSDYNFLQGLAELEGYWLWVEGSELHLERPRVPDQDDAEFTFGEDLQSFFPVANFRKPLSAMEVSAWDSDRKSTLSSSAHKGDELWSMPGGRPGVDLVKFGGTRPTARATDSRITSQAHADAVAKAALTRASQEFITAEVEVRGDPRLVPGALVNLRDVSVYSGRYLVSEANHFLDAAGYHVICYVARDKWGDTSNDEVKPVRPAATPPPPAVPAPAPQVTNPRWKPRASEGLADLAADLDLEGHDGRQVELVLETRAGGGGWAEVARGTGEVRGTTALVSVPLGLVPAAGSLGAPAWEGAGGQPAEGGEGLASVSAKGLEGVPLSLVLERLGPAGWSRIEAKQTTVSGGKAQARFSLGHPAQDEAGAASEQLSAPRWQVAPGDNAGRGWLEVEAKGLADGRTVRLLVERLGRDGRWTAEQTLSAKVAAGRVHHPVDLAHRSGTAGGDPPLSKPRWDGADLLHGRAGTFSVEAPGLDGRRVRFLLERRAADGWEAVTEALATVAAGLARAEARLHHPAGHGPSPALLPGARFSAQTGFAEVAAPSLEGRTVRFRLLESPGAARLPTGDVLAQVRGGRAQAKLRAARPGAAPAASQPAEAELLPDLAPSLLRFRAELLPDLGAQRLRFRAELLPEVRPARLRFRAELPVPEDASLTRVRARLL